MLAYAENQMRANLAYQEVVSRHALADQDAELRADLANQEATLRRILAGLEAQLKVSLANQELEAKYELFENEQRARVALANQDVAVRVQLTNAELQTRAALANQDATVRITLANQDMEFRRRVANNQAALDEYRFRQDVMRLVHDTTLGWMAAQTNNSSALSSVVSTAMNKHTMETQMYRDFKIKAEQQRWDLAMQRASMINGLAGLKWNSQIQNLSVMQQLMASLSPTTSTQHIKSEFDVAAQRTSLGLDFVGSLISLAVAVLG